LLLALNPNLAEAEGMMALLRVKSFLHWQSLAAQRNARARDCEAFVAKERSQEAESPFNRETQTSSWIAT
jgi:hypothetical protein